MEDAEALLQELQELLRRNKDNNVLVARRLSYLREMQLRGKGLLVKHEEETIESWDCENAAKIVEVTRELAQSHVEVGQAMFLQAGVAEQLNEKIALIKEKLRDG